jgi:hypothetical protein
MASIEVCHRYRWPFLAGGKVALKADQDFTLLRARLIKMRDFGLRLQMADTDDYDVLDVIAWVAWAGSQIEALDEHVDHSGG